jgi:myxalamid-type polyketide synthase MxaB
MVIGEALALGDTETKRLQVVLSRTENGAARFQVFSTENGGGLESSWRLNASGSLRKVTNSDGPSLVDLEELKPDAIEIGSESFYAGYTQRGLGFGARFRGVKQIWSHVGKAMGLIEAPLALDSERIEYGLHPALLDACLQVGAAALQGTDEEQTTTPLFMPLGLESFRLFAPLEGKLWSVATVDVSSAVHRETIKAQIKVADEYGRTVAELRGMSFKRADRATLERAIQRSIEQWLYEVSWISLDEAETPTEEHSGPSKMPLNPPGRRWLIMADRGGKGQELAERLTVRGDHCELAFARDGANEPLNGTETLDPGSPADLERFIGRHATGNERPLHGIVYLWPLDAAPFDELDETAVEREVRFWCGSALHLVQAIAHHAGSQPPKLWLCTRGAQKVVDADKVFSPVAATVWGLGKTIALEHPELRCVRLDLAPDISADEAKFLSAVLDVENKEDQVALRSGRRWGARLQRIK